MRRTTKWVLSFVMLLVLPAQISSTEESGPTFSFYGYPHQPWSFDLEQGFKFNEDCIGGGVKDGAFSHCMVSKKGNKHGNVGEISCDYDNADLKILFFGSSYTVTETTDQVRDLLSEKLGKSVCILNFWRDSAGFQNCFDIARDVASEFKPDLIVVANNTLGYAFARTWRPMIPAGDHFWHWYQSLDPDPVKIDPTRAYLQPFVITDLVTKEWAEKMTAAKDAGDEKTLREDPVVVSMIEEYNRIMKKKEQLVAEHGRPLSRVLLNDWTTDEKLAEAVKYVNDQEIPFLVVHVQTLPEFEMKRGGYIFKGMSMTDEEGSARTASFEKVIGKEVIHLIDYYKPEYLEDPVKLMSAPKNWHPGKDLGQKAMAEAFAELILEEASQAAN